VSRASPKMGPPNTDDPRHWSGTEYQNQDPSLGRGRITITRGEHGNEIFRAGRNRPVMKRPPGQP